MGAGAYIWGRYLAGMLVSLGLSALLPAAILGMGMALYLALPDYPAPRISVVLLLWAGMVPPATVVVGSLSFFLGTVLPRLRELVKVAILVGWLVGAVIIPGTLRDTPPPEWYVAWDPTSAMTALGLRAEYSIDLSSIDSMAQLQPYLLSIENRMPDVEGWFGAHLLMAATGPGNGTSDGPGFQALSFCSQLTHPMKEGKGYA